MQVVAKQWLRVLHDRAAHSVNTWEEDEPLPFNPAAHSKGTTEGTLVCQALLGVLPCYKGDWRICPQSLYPASKVGGLQPHVAQLLMSGPNSNLFTHVPKQRARSVPSDFANVEIIGWGGPMFVFHDDSEVPESISSLLPNLEKVHLFFEVTDGQGVGYWLNDLQRLENVRSVSLEALIGGYGDYPGWYTNGAEFNGTPECRVNLKILWNGFFSTVLFFPESLAMHLQSFEIHYLYKEDRYGDERDKHNDIDLSRFEKCHVLEALKFTFTAGYPDVTPSRKYVSDFDKLPKTCKQLVFAVDNGDGRWLPGLSSRLSSKSDPMEGWKVVAGNLESMAAFRRQMGL